MKSMSFFPSETLGLIASYVFINDSRDYQCLNVCTSWHQSFQPYLYRHIRIKTRRQLNQLVSNIQQNTKIGLYVRHLHIQDYIGLSRDQVETLPLLFPFLESLYFNPKLWKYQRAALAKHINTWHRITSLPPLDHFRATPSIIKSIGASLQELTLMGSIVKLLHGIHNRETSKTALLDLLDYTPHLRLLTLYGRDKFEISSLRDLQSVEFTLNDMISLHASLPRLGSIALFDVALSMATAINTNTTANQVPITAPAAQMHTLHVQGRLASYRWIGFIAELYPHLTDLNLNVSWDPSYKQALTWLDCGLIQASLFKIAQHGSLQCIHLGDIGSVLDSFSLGEFFEYLSKQTSGLVSLDNTGSEVNFFGAGASTSFKHFMACTHPDFTKRLKVQLWRDLGSIENVMRSIGQCTKLVELELSGGNYSYSWKYGCDIDAILQHCPLLETVSLNMTRLTFKSKENNLNKGSYVKTIRLIQTHFTTEAMNVLADCCPNLEHFELINCVKDKDPLLHKIHLILPYQHLKTLTIEHLHLRPNQYTEKSTIDAALVALEFTDRIEHNRPRNSNQPSQRWYHLYNHKTKSGRNRQMRRLKLLESLQVQHYSMRDKDWDHLEENSIRGTYREAKHWQNDIPYGYLQVNCRAIDAFVFNTVKL